MRPLCVIEKCGLGAHTPHGFCFVHECHFVIAAYRPGYVDTLPIKRAIRCRMANYGCRREDLAEMLGLSRGEIDSIMLPRRVWVKPYTFDKWATPLHLDISPLLEAVA